MSSEDKSKKELRQSMLEKRNSLSKEGWSLRSQRLCSLLQEHPIIKKATHIMAFYPYGSEPNLVPFLEACLKAKQLYLPKVISSPEEKSMQFFRIHSLQDLRPGFHGILEPGPLESINESLFLPTSCQTEDVCMIVPGMVFDQMHHRIGYGGGFYDRYLALYPELLPQTVAVCFDFQIKEQIPSDPHDCIPTYLIAT